MKPRTLILMGVAVVCGLVASYLTSRMLAQQGPSDNGAKVQVLVAKAKIPYGTQIKDPEKYFVLKEFPAGTEPKRALKGFDEVKDRRVNKIIGAEVFVTPDDLMSKQDEAMAGIITTGMRAFTISVKSDTSVGGFVLPLMRVDVIATIRTDKGMKAKMVLQNALVLGVDQSAVREEGKPAMQSSTVTLQVKPDEAELLTAALAYGDLRLTLRGDGDGQFVKTSGSGAADLLKDKGPSSSETTEGDTGTSTGGSALKLPDVPQQPGAAPHVEEPSTTTHTVIVINGQSVTRHPVTVDRKTGQPTGTDIEKPADPPKPKADKAEGKGDKADPKEKSPEPKDGL